MMMGMGGGGGGNPYDMYGGYKNPYMGSSYPGSMYPHPNMPGYDLEKMNEMLGKKKTRSERDNRSASRSSKKSETEQLKRDLLNHTSTARDKSESSSRKSK